MKFVTMKDIYNCDNPMELIGKFVEDWDGSDEIETWDGATILIDVDACIYAVAVSTT